MRKAILKNPNEFYFHMQLGLELGRMGKKEESFQEYAEALRLAETISINKITPEVREALLTQYSAYIIVERRFTEVIEVLTRVLAKNGRAFNRFIELGSGPFTNLRLILPHYGIR